MLRRASPTSAVFHTAIVRYVEVKQVGRRCLRNTLRLPCIFNLPRLLFVGNKSHCADRCSGLLWLLSFALSTRPPLNDHVVDIAEKCRSKEVVWIDTRRIVARVAGQRLVFGRPPLVDFVGKDVCVNVILLAAQVEARQPVASVVLCSFCGLDSRPFPAIAFRPVSGCFIYPRPETREQSRPFFRVRPHFIKEFSLFRLHGFRRLWIRFAWWL